MRKKSRKPRTRWNAFTPALSRRKHPQRIRLGMEVLEDRLCLAGDLSYQAVAAGALTLRLSGGDLQIVDTANGSVVHASKPLGDITSGVHIDGAGFDVNLTVDASVPLVGGGVQFVGGSGTN